MKDSKIGGFTLIELLVVVAIIAMLATIGFVSYRSANQRSRNARRTADLQQVRSALEMYRTEKGAYPPCDCSGGSCSPGTEPNSWTGMANVLTPTYMANAPTGPKTGELYFYVADTSGGAFCPTYELCSVWEGGSPPSGCTSDSTNYDYGVVNP